MFSQNAFWSLCVLFGVLVIMPCIPCNNFETIYNLLCIGHGTEKGRVWSLTLGGQRFRTEGFSYRDVKYFTVSTHKKVVIIFLIILSIIIGAILRFVG